MSGLARARLIRLPLSYSPVVSADLESLVVHVEDQVLALRMVNSRSCQGTLVLTMTARPMRPMSALRGC